MIERDNDSGLARKPRHRMHSDEEDGSNHMLPLRNILNAIFMLGALVGVIVYYIGYTTPGIIIVLVAMAVKMVECAIRMTVK